MAWGRHALTSVTSTGRPSCAAQCGGGQGAWHPQDRLANLVPGVAGADLERAWGLRRRPAPRGGGAPPRHAGRRAGTPNHCPRLRRSPVPRPRGPDARRPGVRPGPGPLSCRLATWTGCPGSRRAWAMPLRSRGTSRRGARCWRRRSASLSARARWPVIPSMSHGSARSVGWRDAARRPGSMRAKRSTWPGSSRNAGTRRARCTSLASSLPTPIPPMSRRPKPITSRPSPSPQSWACARSRPIATGVWAHCIRR